MQDWPEGRAELLRLLSLEYGLEEPRQGVHLSDLTQCLTLSYLKRVDPQPLTDLQTRYFATGWGFERVLISKLHMEPLELDGIVATPDFELMGVPSELKSTAMSEDGRSLGCAECGLPKAGHTKALTGHAYVAGPKSGFQIPVSWLMRIKGYRYMLNKLKPKPSGGGGRGGAASFGLAVLHLVSRELTCRMLWFSQAELEQNWADLISRANVLENLIAADDGGQPFQWKVYEEECTNCSYSLQCQLHASLDNSRAVP